MNKKRLTGFMLVGLCVMLFTGFCFAQEDVSKYTSCKYCGMDRDKFAYSRMLITYEDGTTVPVCSLHCAAVDLALNIDKTPKSIEVGDYKTKNLIDVEKALWVTGGTRPGVMTKNAKWAFENKADAEMFVKENGGKLTSFDEAIKASYDDMYSDTKMIREKRKMAMMKMKKAE
jgi:copper chaperone NosL